MTLEAAHEVFAELLMGSVGIDAAIASGRVRVEGRKRDARRFFEIFRLPSRDEVSAG